VYLLSIDAATELIAGVFSGAVVLVT